jgi:hypothetical protein
MDDFPGMDSSQYQIPCFVFCEAVYPIRNAGTAVSEAAGNSRRQQPALRRRLAIRAIPGAPDITAAAVKPRHWSRRE